jgi:hypothetical protein
MSDATLQYLRGTALVFTTGAYSDFSISAMLVTIKDCDLPALAKEYRAAEAKPGDYDSGSPEGFGSWLVANGHAMPMDAQSVHLGDYGEFESEFGVLEK